MNRDGFRELSGVRVREAKVLLDNGQYDGAYYLIGYAVECALKACIARQTQRYDFPSRDDVNQSYTHNLEALVRAAKLVEQLQSDRGADPLLDANWGIVKEWRETARYARWSQARAEILYAATTDRRHGVLRWIQRYW